MLLRKSAALAASLLLLTTAAACDDVTGSGGDVDSNLVFTREDGTRLRFDDEDISVWCGDWEEGEVPVRTVWILGGNLGSGDGSFFQIRAVTADVNRNQPLSFPNSYNWNDPDGADVFIYDAEDDNDLSTQESDSRGSITFQELSCERGGEVRFTIDADVGSELGGAPSVEVTGSFSGRVGSRPF